MEPDVGLHVTTVSSLIEPKPRVGCTTNCATQVPLVTFLSDTYTALPHFFSAEIHVVKSFCDSFPKTIVQISAHIFLPPFSYLHNDLSFVEVPFEPFSEVDHFGWG